SARTREITRASARTPPLPGPTQPASTQKSRQSECPKTTRAPRPARQVPLPIPHQEPTNSNAASSIAAPSLSSTPPLSLSLSRSLYRFAPCYSRERAGEGERGRVRVPPRPLPPPVPREIVTLWVSRLSNPAWRNSDVYSPFSTTILARGCR